MANEKHTVGLSVNLQISGGRLPSIVAQNVQGISVRYPVWDSVKNEAELVRWRGNAKVSNDYQFAFEVLFKDANLSKPMNVLAGLDAFHAKAKTFIKDIHARCVELGL